MANSARWRWRTATIAAIAEGRQPFVVHGIRGDEEWLTNPGWAARQGLRAFLAFPLVEDDRVVGIFAVFDREVPTADLVAQLRLLADITASRVAELQSLRRATAQLSRPSYGADRCAYRRTLTCRHTRGAAPARKTEHRSGAGGDARESVWRERRRCLARHATDDARLANQGAEDSLTELLAPGGSGHKRIVVFRHIPHPLGTTKLLRRARPPGPQRSDRGARAAAGSCDARCSGSSNFVFRDLTPAGPPRTPAQPADRGDNQGVGGMAEWLMAAVLKTAVPERVSGVRIPLPPPIICISIE